jgi:hypothetical protein
MSVLVTMPTSSPSGRGQSADIVEHHLSVRFSTEASGDTVTIPSVMNSRTATLPNP